MKNSKLTELLLTLNKEEMKRFGDFIKSPYFNKSTNVTKLYGALKNIPRSRMAEIDKKKLHNMVFKSGTFDDQKIRSLITEFVKLLEKFLILQEFSNDELYNGILQLKYARRKKVPKNFMMADKQFSDFLQASKNRDHEHYYAQIRRQYEIISFSYEDIKTPLTGYFESALRNLDYFYLYLKLSILNSIDNRDTGSTPVSYMGWGQDEMLKFLGRNVNTLKSEHNLIYLEYLIYRIKKQGTDADIKEFTEYIFNNFQELSREELPYYFSVVNKYYFQAIYASAQKDFTGDFYLSLKGFAQKGYFDFEKSINHIDFLQLFIFGIDQNDKTFITGFYERYKDKLQEKYKENTLKIAKAIMCICDKNYNGALENLGKINTDAYYFYLHAKRLSIRCKYELKEYDSMYYTAEAFWKYIRRHREIIKTQFSYYEKFIKYIMKMPDAESNRITRENMIMEIRHSLNFADSAWLIRKLMDIK